VRRVSLIQEKTNGDGIEDLVTAMASTLYGLSREMARAVDEAAP
jgi:predicted regulator of Ras-like GTPase activity (Roadblock/LC7/MglB family)